MNNFESLKVVEADSKLFDTFKIQNLSFKIMLNEQHKY